MSASGKVTITIPETDGSTTSITADLANIVETRTAVQPPPPPPPGAPVVPATALKIDALPMTGWEMNHDAGTSGSSVGTTSYPVTAPDGTPNCRLFDFTNTAGGGEIYHFVILPDVTPYKHVRFRFRRTAAPGVTNSEHDLEMVDANGNPLDEATQEDGYNKVFDVTENHHWVGTGIKVDPTSWVPGSWHDDEIYMTNNGNGTVTYDGVTLDGIYHVLGITCADVDASKWQAKILNLQLQFDTKTVAPEESKVYCSECGVDCWA
jgi:hypothetical protein